MKRSSIFCGIIVLFTVVWAQVSTRETPYGISQGLNRSAIPVATMPVVNVDSLIMEDALAPIETPMRFAYAHPTQLNLNNSGLWEDLDNGDRLWRIKIRSAGAYSISLVYSNYQLPAGAKLFIYNDTETHTIGAFTDYNNKPNGEFSTQPVQGESIIIELYMPPGITGELLEIAFVVHDYRNIFDYGDSESCNNNVNCPEWSDWYDQKRSVGMLLLADNTRLCSGALINNAENEDIQYFLTAEHCVSYFGHQPGDQLNWIIMFNYESPGCANQDGPTDETVQGMIVRAMNFFSDFALLEVNNETIPSDYDVFYSGWSRIDPSSGNTGIHHPSSDIKKISYAAGSATSYYDTHWLVSFTDGTMEHGSSGSPLFNSNYQIVGDLTGPSIYDPSLPYCDQLDMTYGKLSYSWDSDPSETQRLKDWLDPNNTDVQFIDGRPMSADSLDPNPVTELQMDMSNGFEVVLSWTDPTMLFGGDPISDFVIDISRNGLAHASISSGLGSFTDYDLICGQSYQYHCVTRLLANDSTSTAADITTSTTGGEFVLGDITNDQIINMFDVYNLLILILGNDTYDGTEFCAADVDFDNELTVADILRLVDIVSGQP